jgi:hypothetical protein
VAAERLEAGRDVVGVAARGALEQHVLEEVRRALVLGGLVARARAQPHAERDRRAVRHALVEQREAVGVDAADG